MKIKKPSLDFVVFAVTVGLVALIFFVAWLSYNRSPITFYEPIIYPIHVISGDVLVSTNGTPFVFQYAETVTNVNFGNEIITVKGKPNILDRIFDGQAE